MHGERLAANGHRLRGDERERDHARLFALVHPVVDGAALHQHVAGLQVHAADVELHVDLAGDHHHVIDRIGAVLRGLTPGSKLMTRNTVPLSMVVVIFLAEGSASPSLLTGKPSLDQITDELAPGRLETTLLTCSSISTLARP